MTPEEHVQAASSLLDAEQTHEQIDLLSQRYPDIGMDDAYKIQNAIYKAKIAAKRTVIGWKIGLTSKAMRSALGIDIPDSGILFDNMLFNSGQSIPKTRFIQPRIEAEIAFVMKSDIGSDPNITREDVIAATDYVAPSIEILDTRIKRIDSKTGKTRSIFDTISDNAANAGIVIGNEKHAIDAVDLRWVGVITSRNDEVEETGLGAGVLNDPIESVVWLCHRMAQYGQVIKAGHVVLSGSFIRPVECTPGSHIACDFGTFGNVEITFEG